MMSGAERFAPLMRALGSEHCLELLDILIPECGVKRLAQAAQLTINYASQHLQQLRRAGLITVRKSGTRVIHVLSDPEVITLTRSLRRLAEHNLAALGRVIKRYSRNRDDLEPVSRDELRTGLRKGSVTVLDVRPVCQSSGRERRRTTEFWRWRLDWV
jgi:DNA-binding transcriptional ArsR family regulator